MKMRLRLPGKGGGMIKDFAFSFIAYALPTVALQFAVQPLIASRAGVETNGLFLSLFNAIKLCVTVLISTLANTRLLEKRNCIEDKAWDKSFNLLFIACSLLSAAVMVGFSLFYQGTSASMWDYLRLFAVVVLLCAHDFYAIAFRVEINYKNILIDNSLIVLGYGIGLFLFWQFGCWEYVFICGYAVGLGFVLCKTNAWRAGIGIKTIKNILPRYAPLCGANGLGSATIYCDRLLIYPMVGGYAVSVYNAAAVVSKVISVVTTPVVNVLMSYIVDKDGISVKKKTMRKLILFSIVGVAVAYGGLYLASTILCNLLYPQFYADALQYIPIILAAMVLDTLANVFNVVLMRFSKTSLQLIRSVVKIAVYLGSVFLLTGLLKMDLLGFCLAILLADGAKFVLVVYNFMKNITVKNDVEEKDNV